MLMNVQQTMEDVMLKQHAQTHKEVLLVLVKLVTLEMDFLALVIFFYILSIFFQPYP